MCRNAAAATSGGEVEGLDGAADQAADQLAGFLGLLGEAAFHVGVDGELGDAGHGHGGVAELGEVAGVGVLGPHGGLRAVEQGRARPPCPAPWYQPAGPGERPEQPPAA
jgi:hypothetical protein